MQNPANHRIQACLWLINLLRRFHELTFTQISEHWQQRTELSGGNPLPRRTFYDYRNNCFDLLRISIDYDPSANTYYIDLSDGSELIEWLLSSYSYTTLSQQTQQVRQRILLADPPQGMQYFDLVVEAFRSECCLVATYHKFGAEPYQCHLRPYLLKTYEGRWYLFAQKDDEPTVKTFALDRFEQMQLVADEPFHIPASFDPIAYFAHTFGIYHQEGLPPTITLRVYDRARNYLRLSPLHPTQHEQPLDDHTSLFRFECHPTPDLRLAILRQGSLVEVLEPETLRQQVADEVRKLAERYATDLSIR